MHINTGGLAGSPGILSQCFAVIVIIIVSIRHPSEVIIAIAAEIKFPSDFHTSDR